MSGEFNPDRALDFYAGHYDIVGNWILKHGEPTATFGDTRNRRCRFCGLRPPEATFRTQAHAIPASLGNRTLFTAHECDACNQAFGRGIENEFGN
jgi:HNH endonuclease